MMNTQHVMVRKWVSAVLPALAAAVFMAVPAAVSAQAAAPPATVLAAHPSLAGLGGNRAPQLRAERSRWREGAAAGFIVGGLATWFVIHHGGSTSLCDRDRNQDAIGAGECLAITAGGAVAGAAIGALIGSRLRVSGARSSR